MRVVVLGKLDLCLTEKSWINREQKIHEHDMHNVKDADIGESFTLIWEFMLWFLLYVERELMLWFLFYVGSELIRY